jgi:hypothetical protein
MQSASKLKSQSRKAYAMTVRAICFRSLPSNFELTFKFMSGALTEVTVGK